MALDLACTIDVFSVCRIMPAGITRSSVPRARHSRCSSRVGGGSSAWSLSQLLLEVGRDEGVIRRGQRCKWQRGSQRLVALLLAMHPVLPVFMCAHEYCAALFAINSVLLYLHRVAVPAGAWNACEHAKCTTTWVFFVLCSFEFILTVFVRVRFIFCLFCRWVSDRELQAPSAIVAALGALPPPDFNAASLVAHQHAFAWANELVAASLQQYRLLPVSRNREPRARSPRCRLALVSLSPFSAIRACCLASSELVRVAPILDACVECWED
jgi:hypothetical protein